MTTYASAAPTAGRLAIAAPSGNRTRLVASILGFAAAVVAAVLLFRPWPVRNSFEYGELAPVRDAIWSAILVDSLAFAAISISLSLGICALARSRGARLATVGAIVTTIGGVLFAMGAYAFASLVWYVTDAAALEAGAGARLLESVVANPEHLMLAQALGFLLYTLGTLLLAVALFWSRAVPRWLPVAIIAATLAQFGFHDRALDIVQIATMALLVVLAGYLFRARSAEPREG